MGGAAASYFTHYWPFAGEVSDHVGSVDLESFAPIPGVPAAPNDSGGPLGFEHFTDVEPGLMGYENAWSFSSLRAITPGSTIITGDFALSVIVKMPVCARGFFVVGDGATWGLHFIQLPVSAFFMYPRVQYFDGASYPNYDFTEAAFAMGQPAHILIRRTGTTLKCKINKRDVANITGVAAAVDDASNVLQWGYIYASYESFGTYADVLLKNGTMSDADATAVANIVCQFSRS